MKQLVSLEARQQVLNLRREHSLSETARRSGLPLGTVKTICSRSGAFRDNPEHRQLFTLPPMRPSNQTLPAVPELPQQRRVTGDKEIDAVLWLREVISTGQAALIEKAMEAAKRIKTPPKELEERYTKHLVSTNPGNFFAAMSSFNFADLEFLAKSSVEKLMLRNEAEARFGDVDTLFQDTEAEAFCRTTLAGVKGKNGFIDLNDKVIARFKARSQYLPHTLSDCLYELAYWSHLYQLRNAAAGCGDGSQQAYARESFAFWCLAQIRSRSKDESIAVFRYLADDEDRMDRKETNAILMNLIR